MTPMTPVGSDFAKAQVKPWPLAGWLGQYATLARPFEADDWAQ
jgi:hypothetical protein